MSIFKCKMCDGVLAAYVARNGYISNDGSVVFDDCVERLAL